MLFNSIEFLIFLPIVLIIYFLLSRKHQNFFLLAASIFFYASWNWVFIFPLLSSTCIDYYCAKKMERQIQEGKPKSARKRYMVLSLVTNLGLLAYFKYFNFFSENIQAILDSAGIAHAHWALDVILPVGISFYTFQALSYTIDVYRGEIHATQSFFDFLLAVLFFPHLVAGPIQRANNLLAQIANKRRVSREQVVDGLHLIAAGYLKKVFIADNLSPIVDRLFAQGSTTGFETLVATYAFAVQIYCDFSGYTDIARGVAKLMGFEFVLNFNLPYFATNPQDFWKRWHISLSSWLRDYLYISLGGNRGGAWFLYRNLMLTMIIGGLWHGAAWNFVLWGLYHGTLLVAHRISEPYLKIVAAGIPKNVTFLWYLLRLFVMFHLTCYGWLLFRATSLQQVLSMTESLLHPLRDISWPLLYAIVPFALPLLIVQAVEYALGKLDLFKSARIPFETRVIAYSVVAYLVIFRGGIPQSFIYFQF